MPFIADVFGQITAGKIGEMYRHDEIGYLAHKALHGIAGGFCGLLRTGDWKGASSGAISAVIA